MNPRKTVFLDRDGTIIADAHYLDDPDRVTLLPGAAEALRQLRDAGFLLFLLTNQSGVGRGYFDLQAVHRCNERMIELVGADGPLFTEICIAPERPDEPPLYRKPSPRFIDECVAKYGLDRAWTWMVGDKLSDTQTGINAGTNVALIAPKGSLTGCDATPRYASLLDFARALTGAV